MMPDFFRNGFHLRWDNPDELNGRYAGGGGKISLIGLGDAI